MTLIYGLWLRCGVKGAATICVDLDLVEDTAEKVFGALNPKGGDRYRLRGLGLPIIDHVTLVEDALKKSSCISQLPHKSANLSFTITNIKNNLTNLCGN